LLTKKVVHILHLGLQFSFNDKFRPYLFTCSR